MLKFNDELLEKLVKEYNDGSSFNVLSKKYKIDRMTISCWFKIKNVKIRSLNEQNKLNWAQMPDEIKKCRAKKIGIDSKKRIEEFNWLNTKECRDKLREVMKTKEYREKKRVLASGKNNPHYKHGRRVLGYRIIAFEHYGRNCMRCGVSNKKMIVHHVKPALYDESGKYHLKVDNSLINLTVLCIKCHNDIHQRNASDKDKWIKNV